MIIRYCQDGDLPQCIEAFMNSFGQEPWNERWTYQNAREYLEDCWACPGFIGIVAADDNRIMGFLFGRKRRWWDGYELHIDEMGVYAVVQGMGIGARLLAYFMENFIDGDVKRIKLWTHNNSVAYKFYKNRGFQEVSSFVFMKKEC